MVGALTRQLARGGASVDVVTPYYRCVAREFPEIRPSGWKFSIPMGERLVEGEFHRFDPQPGLTQWFVAQPAYFDRPGLYNERLHDYPDNAERFLFFTKAALILARHLPEPPWILHAHDWQAAMAPLLVHHERVRSGWGRAPRTVLTIHNLAYQGWFPASAWGLTNVPGDWFHAHSAEAHGQFNFLKGGIHLADALTTVSPRYAREITTPEFGCGLEGVLRRREYELSGILNGVDYGEWNTVENEHLVQPFENGDWAGKAANKSAFQAEVGLDATTAPLFVNITRLTGQKGGDLLLHAVEDLLASGADIQFFLLGSGEPVLEDGFRRLAVRWAGRVAVKIGFDASLAHRAEAAADFYVMPSRFEPCGLNQLYSLRYGAVPIVRATGGLDDSVVDIRENAAHPTGIKFSAITSEALGFAMRKAVVLYGEPGLLAHYRATGMAADFSWERQTLEYRALYLSLTHGV
jgi:starch synthase